jgi:hypothetical protein
LITGARPRIRRAIVAKEFLMNRSAKIVAAAMIAAGAAGFAGSADAAPIGASALGLHNAAPNALETVQWRRGYGYRGGYGGGYRRGWGGPGAVIGGLAAGAIIGVAIASSRPSYGYYEPAPVYGAAPVYEDEVVVQGAPGGGDDAYCAQRFRSYDPGSGTYLGYDGQRHPCP